MAVLFAFHSNGQDKGYVGVGLGGSLPLGDFASTSETNSKAGYAKGGAAFEICAAYKLGRNFGIAAAYRGTANAVDAQAMADDAARALGTSVKVEVEPWGLGSFMAGGYGSFPVGEKSSFEVKALFGMGTGLSPKLKLTLIDQGNATSTQESKSGSSFTYLFGAGFKFDAGRRICLLAGADYQVAEPEFKDVRITGSNGASTTTSFKQPMAIVTIGVGLAYRL